MPARTCRGRAGSLAGRRASSSPSTARLSKRQGSGPRCLPSAHRPRAAKTEAPDVARGLDAYTEKYPFVRAFLPASGGLEGMRIGGRDVDVRMYRVVPSRLWYLDNERGFSNRAEIPLEGSR